MLEGLKEAAQKNPALVYGAVGGIGLAAVWFLVGRGAGNKAAPSSPAFWPGTLLGAGNGSPSLSPPPSPAPILRQPNSGGRLPQPDPNTDPPPGPVSLCPPGQHEECFHPGIGCHCVDDAPIPSPIGSVKTPVGTGGAGFPIATDFAHVYGGSTAFAPGNTVAAGAIPYTDALLTARSATIRN